MWPLRKIYTSGHGHRRSPRSRSFQCSSFKDILSLCDDHPLPLQPDSPASPPSLSHVFHRIRIYASPLSENPHGPVIFYLTSLTAVRKTFEDCLAVRSILQGYGVAIDERDLFLDSRYVEELRELLGAGRREDFSLPCVFVGGCCVGGAEEVRRLDESGELRAVIEGFPPSSNPGTCSGAAGRPIGL
ncbi:hypothetical protein MLD38_002687 [Melastoma candidum]|uniref:Uncharacterized protein n=1 Tax=Melastoma candidum TaxID=119954 RepID=A0ACB9S384_9MYRT|nr:hypothetical protein MLD38_002687 [Melastoma candidum]